MELIFEGISYGLEESFSVEYTNNEFTFLVNNKKIETALDSDIISEYLKKYITNYGVGQKYTERDFFKIFKDSNISSTVENMIRAFAVNAPFLHFENVSYLDDEFRLKQIDEFFYESLRIDWTGSLETQPQMYLFSKNLLQTESKNLEKIFKMGVIQRISIKKPESKLPVIYYLPFTYIGLNHLTNDKQLLKTWKKIVIEVNRAVKQMVEGK